ncbi:MAG TPA: gamma-glutamylcyclotransferase family protein [Terriglobales bacterium]|nr:gamma-glutamylcyclotransferase family protein [Terriglobales bacterium]
MSTSSQLFVYGTLMRGQRLHRHLQEAPAIEFMGNARIRGKLYHLPRRRYPGAIRDRGRRDFIHGELYRLAEPQPTLKKLDQLEGCDEGLFERRLVNVWPDGENKTKAWAYFFARPLEKATPIPAGRYREPAGPRPATPA